VAVAPSVYPFSIRCLLPLGDPHAIGRYSSVVKRLVVCCDGTWNTPDRRDGGKFAPSNVVKLARAVQPRAADGTHQIVFYDPGVGTDNVLDRLTGGAFGIGLSRNVQDAYLFLIHNYAEGDEVYFFGFSRGAFTVRSTAGLLRKVGILQKVYADRALDAWNLYRKRDAGPDTAEAQAFRTAYSRFPLRIRLIGVWDTVGALGIPGLLNFIGRSRFQFHDVALSRSVDFAFQALAIDEKRKFFAPSLWEQHPDAEGQVLEQSWFPGVHMDVGGGYADGALADGALVWMALKAQAAGLALDEAYLKQISRPNPLGQMHESRTFPYSLIPPLYRPIGKGVPRDRAVYAGRSNETLHESAMRRYREDASYRPPNLVAYLASEAVSIDTASAL
jgi:uncharacterized protein (DUF2235 family)